MTASAWESPALDQSHEHPDLMVGEPVEADHDLDPVLFEESDDDGETLDVPPLTAPTPGAAYFLAPALGDDGLRGEVNARFPNRDKTSDGWIGDSSHAARPSDHNPDWDDPEPYTGIVRAIDVDVDDGDAGRDLRKRLLEAVIGDWRAWYAISNGVIYSATYGWAPRRYTGSNPHYGHVHVSLLHRVGEFDTSQWWDVKKRRIVRKPVSLSGVREQFLNAVEGRPVEFRNGVGRIQQVLNRRHGAGIAADGLVGPSTLAAWARFERDLPGAPRGRVRVPDAKSLPALARGAFRIVE